MGDIQDTMELIKRLLATIHRVQGYGSSADVVPNVFGGVVALLRRAIGNPPDAGKAKN